MQDEREHRSCKIAESDELLKGWALNQALLGCTTVLVVKYRRWVTLPLDEVFSRLTEVATASACVLHGGSVEPPTPLGRIENEKLRNRPSPSVELN